LFVYTLIQITAKSLIDQVLYRTFIIDTGMNTLGIIELDKLHEDLFGFGIYWDLIPSSWLLKLRPLFTNNCLLRLCAKTFRHFRSVKIQGRFD
jgi:hypothetical protein